MNEEAFLRFAFVGLVGVATVGLRLLDLGYCRVGGFDAGFSLQTPGNPKSTSMWVAFQMSRAR